MCRVPLKSSDLHGITLQLEYAKRYTSIARREETDCVLEFFSDSNGTAPDCKFYWSTHDQDITGRQGYTGYWIVQGKQDWKKRMDFIAAILALIFGVAAAFQEEISKGNGTIVETKGE